MTHRNRTVELIAALGFASSLSITVAASEQPTIALRCGAVLDVVGGRLNGPATIIVRGDKIESIGSDAAASRTVDLSSLTCLPGLMDLHTHVVNAPAENSPNKGVGNDLDRSSAARALDGLRNAQTILSTGFTTIRDLGAHDRYYSTVAIRNSIASGEFLGPRMFVAPHMISPTGGHGDINNIENDLHIEIPRVVADGPDEIRRTIREEVKYGADWIKLAVTGGVTSAGDSPLYSAFSEEELRAAVEEAHRLGRKIAVHAIGLEGIKAAVNAGVDSVEHALYVDEPTLAIMKQRGIYLLPTIYVLNYVIDQGREAGIAPASVAKAIAVRDERDKHIRKAFSSGVKIAFGTDTIFPPQQSPREFAAMVELGLPPAEAIRAATINAAQLLGIADRLGTLERGKTADVVAVRGNPLSDVRTLESVKFVMKDGQIVRALQ